MSSRRSAHVLSSPAATCTTPPMPLTKMGTFDEILVPVPSWPKPFHPQHFVRPETSIAQLWP
jgi:hypothetical protein